MLQVVLDLPILRYIEFLVCGRKSKELIFYFILLHYQPKLGCGLLYSQRQIALGLRASDPSVMKMAVVNQPFQPAYFHSRNEE